MGDVCCSERAKQPAAGNKYVFNTSSGSNKRTSRIKFQDSEEYLKIRDKAKEAGSYDQTQGLPFRSIQSRYVLKKESDEKEKK